MLFSIVAACTILCQVHTNIYKSSNFATSLPTLVLFFFSSSYPDGCDVVIYICIFLNLCAAFIAQNVSIMSENHGCFVHQ